LLTNLPSNVKLNVVEKICSNDIFINPNNEFTNTDENGKKLITIIIILRFNI